MASSLPHSSAHHSTRNRRAHKFSIGSSAVPNPKVLLIHENSSLRDEIAVGLIEAGYHVCQAAGRKDGLRLLYAVHPDVVLLEVKPRLEASSAEDSWETLARIRLFTDTPIVVIATPIPLTDRGPCDGLALVEFLEGTFPPDQLLAKVAHALDQHRLCEITSNASESEPFSSESADRSLTSDFLNTAQLMQVDRAISEIGERGEVRLIKHRGHIRFIAKIKTERYQPVPS